MINTPNNMFPPNPDLTVADAINDLQALLDDGALPALVPNHQDPTDPTCTCQVCERSVEPGEFFIVLLDPCDGGCTGYPPRVCLRCLSLYRAR